MVGCKGISGMREGQSGSLGLVDATIVQKIDHKVLLYSAGNYIQYLVINHNGKKYEKNIK